MGTAETGALETGELDAGALDLGGLIARIERTWNEMAAILENNQDYFYGPPALLKHELYLLDGCIQEAKRDGDISELQRCLNEVTRLIKRLKTLKYRSLASD